jgi:2-(1,2-epoxy-1,2-dihydrophenyl)acetyl-CoA isomerase
MSSILFTVEENIGFISLNRPNVFNSFNREMALNLQEVLRECSSDAIRAVHLTGVGKAFCAGQDLQEVIDPNGPSLTTILQEHYNPIIEQIRLLQKPVVAAVNGVAAGAGANLALACDIVVVAKSASFIQAFSKIGLIPDSGGTYFLPRIIGFQKASALMMLGDKVGSEEAFQLGMCYKVLEDENFLSGSREIVAKLAKMPTYGLWLTKKALNASMQNNLTEQLQLEDELQSLAGLSADYKEGVNAFLEKRPANFIGK